MAININKRQIVEEILESNEFKEANIYRELLQYLLLCKEKGTIPKESSIAIDVFNKDLGDDPGKQTKVRVYMHNLRKKLDSYYRQEGKKNKVKIEIPKGKYTLNFIVEKQPAKLTKYSLPLISGLFFALLFFIVFIFKSDIYRETGKFKKSKTWSGFLDKKVPALIVVGDYYLFRDTLPTGREGFLRDLRINSDTDLEKHIEYHPEMKNTIQKTRNSFLTFLAPAGVSKIAPIFFGNKVNYNVKLASEVQWDDLKNNNIVYIGSFKTLYKLQDEFKKLSFNYIASQDAIEIKPTELDTIRIYKTSKIIEPGINKDYAVVAKTRGLNGNNILMFISTHDIGDLSTINQFTDYEKLIKFEKKHFQSDKKVIFEALFEVEGYEKTDFAGKVVYFNKFNLSNQH